MSEEDFKQFLIKSNKNIFDSLCDGGSFYMFYKEMGNGVFITSLKDAKLTFKQELIWAKNNIVLGGNKYQNMYEPCLYGCKGSQVKLWEVGRKEKSVIELLDLMEKEELIDTIHRLLDDIETDVIRVAKNAVNDLHPTMKPIRLLCRFIKNSSKKDGNVLDPFGGSGSTLIACEQMGRNCFMMEYDPKYCDVIINRWEAFTGDNAVMVNG